MYLNKIKISIVNLKYVNQKKLSKPVKTVKMYFSIFFWTNDDDIFYRRQP